MRLPSTASLFAGTRIPALLLAMTLVATPAFADITAFIGSTTTPTNRAVKGAAVGFGLLIVGFEFEYTSTDEDRDEQAPSLRTGMGNVLLQTPFPIAGMQFYATVGGGGYREELKGDLAETVHEETHFGTNLGGGVKISMFGPIRARIDYRLFRLQGEPLHDTVHRIYAGVNLAF